MKLSNRSAVYSPDLFIPKKPTVIRHSEIRLEKNIATGGFAQVWLGIYLPTGQKVAIKKLFSTELTPEILNEINIHSSLHHKFITNFIGYTDEKPFCIVTEYVPNGTLHDALHSSDSKVRLSPTDLTIIATGISSAMSYMHSKRIVHRDLKSLNILLDSRYQPKICDFGISTILDSDSKLNQGFGTASIMSPEQHRQQNFNESVDVYAFGIMLWEMLTRQVPFENIDPIQLIYSVSMKGERPPIPKNTPKLLEFLIRKCWSQTPEERPTFKWIHLELSSGNIQFPGTISSAVSNFFASYGGRTQTNSTFVFAASEPHNKPKSQIASGRRDRTFDTRMEVAEIVNALRNPHKKEFKVALHCIESDPKIRRLMGPHFWELLLPVLVEADHVHSRVLKLLIMGARNQKMLDFLTPAHKIENYIHQGTLELYLYIICFSSSLISSKMIRNLKNIVVDEENSKVNDIDKAIRLMCKILENTTEVKYRKTIVKFFYKISSNSFNNVYGSFILKTIALNMELIKVNNKSMLQLTQKYFNSTQPQNITAAYQVVLYLSDLSIINFDDCLKHCQSEYCPLREISIEYFRRIFLNSNILANLDIVMKVIIIFIKIFEKSRSQNAALLLFYFASKQQYFGVFLNEKIQNMILTVSNDMATDIFQLFILLLKIDSNIFLNNQFVPNFLASILKFGDLHSFAVVCSLISNYSINSKVSQKFEDNGIISMICERIKHIDNVNAINYAAKALVKFVTIKYNTDYDIVIPKFIEKIKEFGSDAYPCVIALSYMSEYKNTLNLMKRLSLSDYITPFLILKATIKYAQKLEERLNGQNQVQNSYSFVSKN